VAEPPRSTESGKPRKRPTESRAFTRRDQDGQLRRFIRHSAPVLETSHLGAIGAGEEDDELEQAADGEVIEGPELASCSVPSHRGEGSREGSRQGSPAQGLVEDSDRTSQSRAERKFHPNELTPSDCTCLNQP
jgi:hypothetical protein